MHKSQKRLGRPMRRDSTLRENDNGELFARIQAGKLRL